MAPTRDIVTFRTSLFQILLKNIFIAKITGSRLHRKPRDRGIENCLCKSAIKSPTNEMRKV